MGLTDKVKAQATEVAQKTQKTAQTGKAKYDQAQASRHADAMLQQLGAAVYAERTGGGTAGSQAKIDKLVNDISAYERDNGLNLTARPQPAGAARLAARPSRFVIDRKRCSGTVRLH